MLDDVVNVVGGGQDLGLVNVVDTNGFEDLACWLVYAATRKKWMKVNVNDSYIEHTWHSTKWPILALAITGMVTASMISLIILGSDILETPPSARMSAGTRSSAITATAPASSAILAWRTNC